MAQADLKGIKIRDNMHKVQPSILGDIEVTMPVRSIFRNSDDVNYKEAKRAFHSLSKKEITFEDENTWMSVSLIWKPRIEKGTGIATFTVAHEIWQCIEDFSKGYRKYELETAKNLKSVYAMRFYELVSGQTEPLTQFATKNGFAKLCDILKLPISYRKTQNFENRVLNIAKAELDANCPYSFKYERVTVPSRGRRGEKVIGYIFYPVYISKNRDPELDKRSIAAQLPAGGRFGGLLHDNLYAVLTKELGWSKNSVNSNKELFMLAQERIPNLIDKLRYWSGMARTAEHPIGYVINSIKNELNDNEIR